MITLISVMVTALLLAGSLVYCLIAVRAAALYRRTRADPAPAMPFITIMKPLSGAEDGLRENLRSFFEQDYPEFEVLLAVETAEDSAARIAREVMAEYSQTHSRLILSGSSPTPNRKVHSLSAMYSEARYDILLMADSDIRTGPDLLRVISNEFAQENVALVTCPYRASAGSSIWTATEAIGLNTEFFAQILVARILSGMDFALGPTLAIRRTALDSIGGFPYLRNFLAEDFVMGKRVSEIGGRVVLSSYLVEHRLGAQEFRKNFAHRLRWARSTRRSRPVGYIGQIFTNPIPLAILLTVLAPRAWPALLVAGAFRAFVAWATAFRVLRDPLTRDYWYLVPLQDIASFLVWLTGFFGSAINWRGKVIKVTRDGRFETG